MDAPARMDIHDALALADQTKPFGLNWREYILTLRSAVATLADAYRQREETVMVSEGRASKLVSDWTVGELERLVGDCNVDHNTSYLYEGMSRALAYLRYWNKATYIPGATYGFSRCFLTGGMTIHDDPSDPEFAG